MTSVNLTFTDCPANFCATNFCAVKVKLAAACTDSQMSQLERDVRVLACKKLFSCAKTYERKKKSAMQI